MYKYYLFIIKEEIRQIFNPDLEKLYVILENIYLGKINNLNYRVSIYDQICETFNVFIIRNYLKKTNSIIKYKDKYLYKNNKEISLLKLGYATIIIASNQKFPLYFHILNLYNKRIFVCNFKNKEYFWLQTKIKK